MADTEIKNKVMHGLFWKILENGGAQGIQFVIAIILARLLSPAEYGLVSIIMIFITIANVVVQNGFSTALVQKRHSDDVDFSSVFYFSLAIAAAMYVVLYMAAPSIAGFYRSDVLVPIVRVLSVVLFPGAVISVQTAYVSRKMEFKGLFKATMAAVLVSGAVSITMAFRGLGVWAMVGQQISYYLALMTALFVTVSWKPGFMFAIGRVRAMFAFGWKLLLAALLDTLFNNLYGLIMGKIYNEELLGAYNRGDQFPKLIVNNLGAAIQAVLLPAFSSRQGDIAQVRSMVRRAIRTSSFLVLPMLLGLFAVADTMVLALLGEKWMICVPYRILLLAHPHHQPSGHQCGGAQRYFPETGGHQEIHRYHGTCDRGHVQPGDPGVHQGGDRFSVYLYQRMAQQEAAWVQHIQPVDGYHAFHGSLRCNVHLCIFPAVCTARRPMGETGYADRGRGPVLRGRGLDIKNGKFYVSAGNDQKKGIITGIKTGLDPDRENPGTAL